MTNWLRIFYFILFYFFLCFMEIVNFVCHLVLFRPLGIVTGSLFFRVTLKRAGQWTTTFGHVKGHKILSMPTAKNQNLVKERIAKFLTLTSHQANVKEMMSLSKCFKQNSMTRQSVVLAFFKNLTNNMFVDIDLATNLS